MFCAKCGAEIKAEFVFCPVCGNGQKTMTMAEEKNILQPVYVRKFSETKKMIAGILIILFIGIAGGFLFVQQMHYFTGNRAPVADNKDSQRNDKEALRSLLLDYTNAWANAVNQGDFSIVQKYLLTGSELYTAQKALQGDLAKDGVKLELIKAEIADISVQPEQGIATVNVLEEYNVISGGIRRQVSRCYWTYTANYIQGEGWKLSKIAENSPPKTAVAKPVVVMHQHQQEWIDLQYPQLEDLASQPAQNKINAVLKKRADDYFATLQSVANQSRGLSNYDRFRAKSSYSVTWQSDDMISLLCSTYSYTGGAHGSQSEIGYNFDLRTGDIITLRDKVGDDKIRTYNETILQQIRDKKIPIFEPYKGISDRTTYYIVDSKNLVVVFQQYEIAPYSSGILRFTLPY